MHTTVCRPGNALAASGVQTRLQWHVLPARGRCAESLRNQAGSRKRCVLHASEITYIGTAASGVVSDGMSLAYLATTVSAGLILLFGAASAASQRNAPIKSTDTESVATAASTGDASSKQPRTPVSGTEAAGDAKTWVAASDTPLLSKDVAAVRQWISAYRTRTESAGASAAPSSFSLSKDDIAELESAATEELNKKSVTFESAAAAVASKAAEVSLKDAEAISAVAEWPDPASSEVVAEMLDNSASMKNTGRNPIQNFIAWLKALWAAIVKFFQNKQSNEGSGAAA